MPSQRLAALLLGTLWSAGCVNTQTGAEETVTGTFVATILTVTLSGGSPVDALAAGGSMHVTVNEDGTTSGSLSLPASVTGGAAVSLNLEGTAVITGLTVRFNTTADSFMRSVIFSRQSELLLIADNQAVAGTAYTIALLRQ